MVKISVLYGHIIALFKNLKFQCSENTIEESISILSISVVGLFNNGRIQAREIYFTLETNDCLKKIVIHLKKLEKTKVICQNITNKELEKFILVLIEEEALRCSYLDSDKIMTLDQNSLFDCRSDKNPQIFAKLFYIDLVKLLHEKKVNWLNIVPIMKVRLDSFNLGYDDISIINRHDKNFWSQSSNHFKNGMDYDIYNFAMKDCHFNRPSLENNILIICKNKGSQEFSKIDALLKIKKIISILFSFISVNNEYMLTKSSHTEKSVFTQFPSLTSNNHTTESMLSEISPCYIKEYFDSDFNVQNIKDYYCQLSKKNDEIKNRVFVATNYINHAMNGLNENDIFLNYYISLDALFGIKHQVGKSIERGINFIINDEILKSKSKYLYELRNDLVHGGIRYIEEWDKYEKYYNEFKSDILTDIEKLAFECLNKYPFKIENNFFNSEIKEIDYMI